MNATAQQMIAIVERDGMYVRCDQPTTCPKCGSRTEWVTAPEDELPPQWQCDYPELHTCLNKACGHVFVTCDDNDEDEDDDDE